ncbi:MAG: threonine/serine exporter family protein, partial [Clostridia bacterium]|nr:threonine/serine exporter family protein [Clostridia bacterium]
MNYIEALKIILSGTIGTLGFSLLFKSNPKRTFFNALGGAITCIVYVVCCELFEHEFMQNIFPALAATAYAEIMARVLKAPATPILACSIIPLVPGGKLYYTTYYFVVGQMSLFEYTLRQTLRIAAGLAVGIIIVSVIVNEINSHKFKAILD